MNNVSPLRFFGSAPLFVSSQDPSLPPASHPSDTLYLGPSPSCVSLSLVFPGPHNSLSPQDILMLRLSHRKHLVGHQRRSLLQKSQVSCPQLGIAIWASDPN